MTEHSLFPAHFKLFYTTEFAPHAMTIPCRTWSPSGGDAGSFLAWDTSDREAVDMIGDLVDLLIPFHVSTTEFNSATIYTQDSEDDPPRPRGFVDFSGKVGTSAGADTPASQSMYTFRSDNFGLAKYLFFDAPVASNFAPFTDITASAALEDLFEYIKADTNAICARDNGQIAQFVKATFKLNDKLRHEYHYD